PRRLFRARRLAALDRAEDQHVGLLRGDLVDELLELMAKIAESRKGALRRNVFRRRRERFRRVLHRLEYRAHAGVERFAELAENGAHERRGGRRRGEITGLARVGHEVVPLCTRWW